MPEFLNSFPEDAHCLLLLAHGAGAPMTSPFLDQMTDLLAARGIGIVRFEFGYMAARRSSGKRRPPPKAEALIGEYATAISTARKDLRQGLPLFIGGKSLGGRVASLVADTAFADGQISGLVCLGYPFHPPGQPDRRRTAHLETLVCPTLVIQGQRDPFGSQSEVEQYRLSPSIDLVWIADGDHDFGPRGASGYTRTGNLTAAADAAAAFMRQTASRP